MAKEWAKKFYKSTAWIKCRKSYISTVYGLCERCGKPGYIVHHKVELNPININDTEVSLNHDNLEYLCFECHNDEHKFGKKKNKATRSGLKFNKDGQLVQE